MTPSDYYRQKISSGEILPDAQQFAVIAQLDHIHHCLSVPQKPKGWFARWSPRSAQSCRGLYIWGSVGIGKTLLLDTFYYTLPFSEKLRIHFYAFMQQVQAQLQILQGHPNPLRHIARDFAKQYRVICFDELMVHDIADAMVLGGLFTALFQEGVCLLFTSNVPPEGLYLKGLQRARFLPAIAQIQAHTQVIHVGITEDYRSQSQKVSQYYWYPLTTHAYDQLEHYFQQATQGLTVHQEPLNIVNRTISVKKWAEGVVWFDFMAICGIPRNQADYLEIAQRFHTVLISNLMVIGKHEHDLARSLIRLVDVLYDRKIRLIIAAAQPIEQIYPEGLLTFEFARTQSRLRQMQLEEWL